MERVFFALWPGADAATALLREAQAAKALYGGRPMRLDTLHLTLAFIGDWPCARLPRLHAAAACVTGPAVAVRLDYRAGWRHNGIVWAGMTHPDPALLVLAARLSGALRDAGVPLERRPFQPHVTLLRNSAGAAPAWHEARPMTVIEWVAQEFVLVASRRDDGGRARYDVLARWPLGAATLPSPG